MVYEHRIWSLRGVYTSLDSQNTCHIPQLTQCYPQNKTASQNSNSSLRTGTIRVWNQPSGAITIAMEQWNFIFEENALATWLPFGEMELYGCTDDIRLLSSIINHQSSKKWHVIINHEFAHIIQNVIINHGFAQIIQYQMQTRYTRSHKMCNAIRLVTWLGKPPNFRSLMTGRMKIAHRSTRADNAVGSGLRDRREG